VYEVNLDQTVSRAKLQPSISVLQQIAENGSALFPYTEGGGAMSDGYEERQETRVRIEQERREDREDRIHIDDVDEGEPERVDS
jgi:hypothetical protein